MSVEIIERIPHAYVEEALLERSSSMSRETWVGLQAACHAMHGPYGWRGPFYAEHRTQGGHKSPFIEAQLDAVQHDLSEHAKYLREEPAWDNIISGAWEPPKGPRERAQRPLGVPFKPVLMRGALSFWNGLMDFWKGLVSSW